MRPFSSRCCAGWGWRWAFWDASRGGVPGFCWTRRSGAGCSRGSGAAACFSPYWPLDALLFVLAARLASIAVVMVLAQGTTVSFVVLMHRLYVGRLYRRLTPLGLALALLLLLLLGFGLVMVSGPVGPGYSGRRITPRHCLWGLCWRCCRPWWEVSTPTAFALGRQLALDHPVGSCGVPHRASPGGWVSPTSCSAPAWRRVCRRCCICRWPWGRCFSPGRPACPHVR